MIAGAEGEVALLASAAREADADLTAVAEPPNAARSVSALAGRLREVEASLTAEPPDAVLVADDTDTALAALLVATKLRVPAAAAGGVGSTSPNGRLIAQLADQRLGGGPGAVGDWARAYTEAR